ncbi:hypothetical protein B0H14DRAFT_3136316 [Mycena olivaceomarginata]|nr:hypothetical protein B0H14DRAFT_3136316 [Mycena olivaceomarginata]
MHPPQAIPRSRRRHLGTTVEWERASAPIRVRIARDIVRGAEAEPFELPLPASLPRRHPRTHRRLAARRDCAEMSGTGTSTGVARRGGRARTNLRANTKTASARSRVERREQHQLFQSAFGVGDGVLELEVLWAGWEAYGHTYRALAMTAASGACCVGGAVRAACLPPRSCPRTQRRLGVERRRGVVWRGAWARDAMVEILVEIVRADFRVPIAMAASNEDEGGRR